MIVRIERHQESPEATLALIRDRSQSFHVAVPFDHVEQLFGRDDHKVYCRAALDDDGLLRLGKRIRCQPF